MRYVDLMKNIRQLDVLRGVAILAVYLFHLYGWTFGRDKLPWLGLWRDYSKVPSQEYLVFCAYSFGYLGVTLFFVLSGFCIHLSFLNYEKQLVERGEAFRMDVVFDEAAQGLSHRFEPELPLLLRL